MPRCVVHGDFWTGNIAADGAALRVFDWEWSSVDQPPFLDHWSYELNVLRALANEAQRDLDARFAAATERVRASLGASGLDPRFAAAMLAPVAAELVSRLRLRTGEPNGWEAVARPFLASVEATISRPAALGWPASALPKRYGLMSS